MDDSMQILHNDKEHQSRRKTNPRCDFSATVEVTTAGVKYFYMFFTFKYKDVLCFYS